MSEFDGIDTVRGALEATLAEVSEIKSVSGWPTDQVGSLPYAFVGFDDEDITGGQRELTLFNLELTVIVTRKGSMLVNETKTTESIIEPIKAKLRMKRRLGIPYFVDDVRYTRVRGGVFEYAGTQYTGFVMTLQIKTHKGVSFSG